mmetsp:Transcript_25355/g.45744  ORF Transcript_25355/g.45744 Transcript_25355/m.45744 type:complete len:268 (+) Transcript_25355:103-906(+)
MYLELVPPAILHFDLSHGIVPTVPRCAHHVACHSLTLRLAQYLTHLRPPFLSPPQVSYTLHPTNHGRGVIRTTNDSSVSQGSHSQSKASIILTAIVLAFPLVVNIAQIQVLVGRHPRLRNDHGSALSHPLDLPQRSLLTRSSFAVDDEPLEIVQNEAFVHARPLPIGSIPCRPIRSLARVHHGGIVIALVVLGTPPSRIGIQRHVMIVASAFDALAMIAIPPQSFGELAEFLRQRSTERVGDDGATGDQGDGGRYPLRRRFDGVGRW